MQKPVAGAQLYSLRDYTRTLEDLKVTLPRVARMGYTAVQLSAVGPVDPGALADLLAANGLTAAATHVGWDRFRTDLDRVIAEHRRWGCVHAAIGGLPGEYFVPGGVARFLAELRPIAERLLEAGIDFSYHNHHHELARHGEATWLEQLYRDADPRLLKAELDTYWVQAGGGDPAWWVRRCAGREPLLHLKDMCITPEREQRFAPVGEGNLNWDAILGAAEEGGVRYLLVEQDNCYGRDPFDCLAASHRFLAARGYR